MSQQALWDRRYGSFSKSPASREDGWLASCLCRIPLIGGQKALDLGCGAGSNALQLLEKGLDVTACDFSPQAISLLRQSSPSITTLCFDMTQPWPEEITGMDIVVASLSTHYFSLSDTRAVYQRVYRALSEGGYFIFRVNSKAEFDHADKANAAKALEKDYYLLSDGSTKRYFDAASLSPLLRPFELLHIKEAACAYHGRVKHYIEGIVVKRSVPIL